jgi:hypothetical protein
MTRLGEWGTVDLYWIPLGAGARIVRLNGLVFEWLSALVQRRPRCDLYHSALVVDVPEGKFVVEMAPIPDRDGRRRGVVAEGPVGTRRAGRFRVFRYEIRRWRGGRIPDVGDAVASPVRVSSDPVVARRVLAVLPSIPTPVWGRDELQAGEMWNSNSVISWVLVRGGVDASVVHPPRGGRAPGRDAGLVVAARSSARAGVRLPDVPADAPPDGGLGHLTWWEGDDNHNLDAWENEAAFAKFGETRLGPAMAEVGVTSEPEVTSHPAHEIFLPNALTILAS